MLAAIEIYNKPQTTYREQVVTVLAVNAWELILKAVPSAKHRELPRLRARCLR